MAGKYHNVPTVVDNVRFASRLEARRYVELRTLLRAGKISHLDVHPRFPLDVCGVRIGFYIADFAYHDLVSGWKVVEDVKSRATITPVYRLKKKLMLATFGIAITEVTA